MVEINGNAAVCVWRDLRAYKAHVAAGSERDNPDKLIEYWAAMKLVERARDVAHAAGHPFRQVHICEVMIVGDIARAEVFFDG